MRKLTTFAVAILVGIMFATPAMAAEKLFIMVWNQDHAREAMEFQKVRPDVEMEVVVTPTSVYRDRIMTLHAVGEAPDVFWVNFRGTAGHEFLDANMLEDLNPWVDRSSTFHREDHHPEIMHSLGKNFLPFVPYIVSPYLFYYRADLVAAAGVEAPEIHWTIDEARDLFRRVTKRKPDGEVEMWGHDDLGRWSPWTGPLGLQFFNEDGTKVTVDNPVTKQGFEFLHQLAYVDGVIPPAGKSIRFSSGMTASGVYGTWNLANRQADADIGVAVLPEGPGGYKPLVLIEGWSMSAQSKNKELAWEFIEFMNSDEMQMGIAARQDSPAKLPIALQHAFVDQPLRHVIIETIQNGSRSDWRLDNPVVPHSVIEEAYRQLDLNAFLTNEKPLQQVIDEAVPRMQAVLDRAIAALGAGE